MGMYPKGITMDNGMIYGDKSAAIVSIPESPMNLKYNYLFYLGNYENGNKLDDNVGGVTQGISRLNSFEHMKYIFSIRNPIDAAWSHYCYFRMIRGRKKKKKKWNECVE